MISPRGLRAPTRRQLLAGTLLLALAACADGNAAANPDGERLYFTEAEWDAFVLGVKDGEFDLDESGNLP